MFSFILAISESDVIYGYNIINNTGYIVYSWSIWRVNRKIMDFIFFENLFQTRAVYYI